VKRETSESRSTALTCFTFHSSRFTFIEVWYGKRFFASHLVRIDQLRSGHHPGSAVYRRAREAAALPHAARPGQGAAEAEDVLPRRWEGSASGAHDQRLRDRERPVRDHQPGRARGGGA